MQQILDVSDALHLAGLAFEIVDQVGLLELPTLKNPVIGNAVGTSIAVIGLYIAFLLPIILRYRQGEKFERGVWNLGKHYRWIDPLAGSTVGIRGPPKPPM